MMQKLNPKYKQSPKLHGNFWGEFKGKSCNLIEISSRRMINIWHDKNLLYVVYLEYIMHFQYITVLQ